MKLKKRLHLALIGFFSWRYSGLFVLSTTTIGFLLLFHLGRLPGGFSQPELAAQANARSLSAILENPLFLPHKLLQYGFMKVGLRGIWPMRFVSTIFAAAILVAFYRILKSWFTIRVAIIGTLVFASSSWFLHSARLATPSIMYASVIGILWVGARIKSHKPRRSTTLMAAAIGVGSLYIPGFIWFLVPGFIWQRKTITHELARTSKLHIFQLLALAAASVAPLIYAFVKTPSLLIQWLGIAPNGMSPTDILQSILNVPLWLVYHAPTNPVYWLGSLSLLDAMQITMLVLGGFSLFYMIKLDRIKALLGVLSIGVVLAGLGGISKGLVLAPVFLVISSGLALLLQQWFTVFPKNPFAKTIGVGLIIGLVVLSCSYQTKSYFVAWPKSSQTIKTFGI